jgi:hypothetical protein
MISEDEMFRTIQRSDYSFQMFPLRSAQHSNVSQKETGVFLAHDSIVVIYQRPSHLRFRIERAITIFDNVFVKQVPVGGIESHDK